MSGTYKTSYGVKAYLEFVGVPLTLGMDLDDENQIFRVELEKFTLNKLITGIVQIVKPGYKLSIPTPWSYILDHEIPKFELLLKAPKNGGSKEFGISFDPHFDEFGLNIKNIEVFARSIRDVNINMTGNLSFLGLDYPLSELFGSDGVNLLGAEGLPKPAPKPSLIDLKFIGIGQHLQLKKAAKYNHVNEVVDDMLTLFDPPKPGTVVPEFTELLKFSNDSQWLFGLDIEIMKTVVLQIVFNDPVLYGLYISLSGEKAKALAGLEFEILYKKITDDIGVYQLELKLPDAIRNMEFGAVSVTLPVIAVWIYTNGNFKVDLGFPYNNDFSRSFTVQSFPFIGQGGFYFSYLNGATSTTVPKTELGTFDPVLEFGIGMNIGLGKTFNKGILKAGITLTFYGVLEGTLAWFKPYDTLPSTSGGKQVVTVDTNLTDFFYKVKGTFGIIGHIYGSVNFAIISATVDIVAYAQATVTIEAAEPIYLSFEAGVSVRLTVKIKLGFFKIKIHLSFSATVRESFTLGSPEKAQWNTPIMLASAEGHNANAPLPLTDNETQVLIPMNWGQIFTQNATQNLSVKVVPLFSADKKSTIQTGVGVSTLFVENNRGQNNSDLKQLIIDKDALNESSPFQEFDKLCIGILGWIFNTTFSESNAAKTFEELLDKKITNVTVANILYTIDNYNAPENQNTNNGTVPFTYKQTVDFIKSLFVLNITDPNLENKKTLENNPEFKVNKKDIQDLYLTIFPMIPQLFMSNSDNTDVIDFDAFNGVNDAYLEKVTELVKQFTNSSTAVSNNEAIDVTNTESIAALIFRDYFSLIGKSLLQSASDIMEVYNYTLPSNTLSLKNIADTFTTTATAIVNTNKAQRGVLIAGKTIAIASCNYSFETKETFSKLKALKTYTLSNTEWAQQFISLNKRVKMFVPLVTIKIPKGENFIDYTILEDETLEIIINKNKLTTEQQAKIISLNTDNDVILSTATEITLPTFNETIPAEATFLSIATNYGIELLDISSANIDNADLMNKDAVMMIQYVSSLSISEILNAVYQKDFFTGAGGSASRFALHGVRLPNVITDGDPGSELQGLYELSGQQFTLPTISDKNIDTFSYTFTLSKTAPGATTIIDPLPWVLFNGVDFIETDTDIVDKELATLPYKLHPDEVSLVKEFQNLTFSPTLLEGPSNLKLYEDQTKTFSFNNPIVWKKDGTETSSSSSIWDFSKSLMSVINKKPEINLNVSIQEKPNTPRTITPLEASNYSYGTLLPLSVRKLTEGNTEGINQKTFEVFGTDATGIEILTALLKAPSFDNILDEITILYSSDPKNDEARELKSISSKELLLLLINTNLSTETNPENVSQAEGDEKITNTPISIFIERIWKASLVKSGGYYLYYDTADGDTLPNNLFTDNGEAEIYFLLTYKNTASENILEPYLNTALLNKTIDASQELLFGEWQVDLDNEDHNKLLLDGKIERNAIIKQGNVGFDIVRENPNKKYGDETGVVIEPNYPYDLEQQYNLLNFNTIAEGKFKALESVIPVGPTDNKNVATNDAPNNDENTEPWNYNKAMPVVNFYTNAGEKSNSLNVILPPPANNSPYLGLTETLNVGFNWQDNYGNVYDTPINNLPYKILYFDEIIPLSAWPALTVEYWFATPSETPVGNTNNFNISLTFKPGDKYSWDPSGNYAKANKENVLKQARADFKKYITIYYQIVQEDLGIELAISTNPSIKYPKETTEQTKLKTGIITYLNTVTQWIANFIKNPDTNNQFKLTDKTTIKAYDYGYTFSTTVTVTNAEDIFALSVEIILSRNKKYIDPQFILQTTEPKIFVPGVQSIISVAKPKSSGLLLGAPSKEDTINEANNKDLLALSNFAYSFENTFKNQQLKVTAAYVSGEDSNLTTEKEEELWVVRFKDINSLEKGIGYDIKYDEASYYAPQPLVNFLASLRNVTILPYSSYTLNSTEGSTTKTFNNIDVEVWGRNFLSSLETVFTPEMSLPITMVDHLKGNTKDTGILAGLLKAKEKLAKAISLQTIPILQGDNTQKPGFVIAREKLRQQLLINLIDGYNINAVIQYNTSINTSYPNASQSIAPNLYGKPFVDNSTQYDNEKNYALSTAKVPLLDLYKHEDKDPGSYLTYTFTTQNPALDANLPLPINYQINHMEFDISTLESTPGIESEDLKNFDLSKWLTFIRPLEVQKEGEIIKSHIPIPIREYPTLPVFGSQIFNPEITSESTNVSIEKAKLSDFSFDYVLDRFVAQDTYHFETYFNAKEADWPTLENEKGLTPKQVKLFTQLAQYEAVYKDFLSDFSDKLPKINADISKTDLDEITKILSSYEDLTLGVAQDWLNLFSPDMLAAAEPSVKVVKAKFQLQEYGSMQNTSNDDDNYFQISITKWSVTEQELDIDYVKHPLINIPKYNTKIFACKDNISCADPIEIPNPIPSNVDLSIYKQIIFRYTDKVTGIYLSFEQGVKLKKRTIEFKDLSVLQIQNGWAGFYVERNANLGGNATPIVETSPEFLYKTPVRRFNTPIIPSSQINKQLPLGKLPVENDNLIDYLKKMLSDLMLIPSGDITPVKLKILVNYNYTIAEEAINLPVLLISPALFNKDDVSGTGVGVEALQKSIINWFKINTPELNKGKLIFAITFYSSIDGDNTLPLLTLSDVLLEVKDVADILNIE